MFQELSDSDMVFTYPSDPSIQNLPMLPLSFQVSSSSTWLQGPHIVRADSSCSAVTSLASIVRHHTDGYHSMDSAETRHPIYPADRVRTMFIAQLAGAHFDLRDQPSCFRLASR
jgi:hypothetical protein